MKPSRIMATAPGKHYRKGMTLVEFMQMFPTEDAARNWFESWIWKQERKCPYCGSHDTVECKQPSHPMPYRCHKCRQYFSVKTGTVMERSKVPLQKWAIAIYLHLTNLKGVSSMKLHRDIGVTQKTAWFMLQRIREAWTIEDLPEFGGPVEADETYMGGKRKNMSNAKRKALKDTGRGAVGKTAVIGVKDRETNEVRAKVVVDTTGKTLKGFVLAATLTGTMVYTDDATAYNGISRPHESVKHSVSEYVNGMAHTNGIESFWSMLKRGYHGTYHHMSEKHLNRYVNEFAGRHNIRCADTESQMSDLARMMKGKRVTYRDLVEI